MTSVNNVTNTVNTRIVNEILIKSIKGEDSSIQNLFNDGEKVYNDSLSDTRTNKKDISDIKNKIKSDAKSKGANTVANKKAGGVDKGSSLWGGTATGKAKISGNTATIEVQDKNGKKGTSVYKYASDGSYVLTVTIGDTVTERAMDKNGNLREMITKNKKTNMTVTNEYDSSGKINSQTETDSKRPNWKLTRFFDDNGQKSRNIVKDGTKTYTTDFEYDKSGKCITEQIRSYYDASPSEIYYRTNIFDGDHKTSIDNNPDGSKIISESVKVNGEWDTREKNITRSDGTVEKRTTEGKKNGQRVVKVETIKNGKTNTTYNLHTFNNDGKHVTTAIYSDKELKNKTTDITYSYNKDGYQEKTEVINYTKNQKTVKNIDAKTGKTKSVTNEDILVTKNAFNAELEKGVKEGKITTEEANVAKELADSLDNKIYEFVIDSVEERANNGTIGIAREAATLESFAKACMGGRVVYGDNTTGSTNRVAFSYGGTTYIAQASLNIAAKTDADAYTIKYWILNSETGIEEEVSGDDPRIKKLNEKGPDSIFQKSLKENSGAIFIEDQAVQKDDKTGKEVKIGSGYYARRAPDSLAAASLRLYTEDDAKAQAEYNAAINKLAQEKKVNYTNEELQNYGLSKEGKEILTKYQEKRDNTIFEATVDSVEKNRNNGTLGTTREALALSSLAKANMGGYITHNGEPVGSTNRVAFSYEGTTYIAQAFFNLDATKDSDAYTIKYWIMENGKEKEVSGDDPRIKKLNEQGPDSIFQKSLKENSGTIFIEDQADQKDDRMNGEVKIGSGYYIKKAPYSLAGVASRYYTEDDAKAQAEYNKAKQKLSDAEIKQMEKLKQAPINLVDSEFINDTVSKFLKYTGKRK